MREDQNFTVSIFCPKCGHKIVGQKSGDGSLKMQCDRCKAVVYSKPKGKRELNIKMVLQKMVV